MIEINEKKDCCGCTGCVSVCPTHCIKMVADEEGFLYPQVEKDQCINCSRCEKVCPIINKPLAEQNERKAFVVRCKDRNILEMSTSGGFFLPMAKKVLALGGTVCAATYDNDFRIVHQIIADENNSCLEKSVGSKYVQSDIRGLFETIREYLKLEKLVLFVGTPCQVSGLKNYLGKDYDCLITIDVVCHGVGSPLFWEKYLKYQTGKFKTEINKISFRKKRYGYHSSTMAIYFRNGKQYCGSGRVDYFLKGYFSGLLSRPSCYSCAFKDVERCSDFTIYDCWTPNLLNPNIRDDDKGYTNVIIQSKKGETFLESLKNEYFYFPSNIEKAIELDGIMMKNSDKPHSKRTDFFKGLKEENMEEHIRKFITISKKDRVIEKLKGVFYKLKIFQFIKKIKPRN